jgi:two-component system phosphate regulon response regulator PhoB
VLIVEDDPDIAELIRFHVDREGWPAQVTALGRTALESVKRQPPDLLVLDLMLPDLDGLEICRRIRRDEAVRTIPILIVSAKGEEADIVTGLEIGADDYVTKPFSPRVLIARMRNMLRRHTTHSTGDPSTQHTLADGQLTIDVDRHRVHACGNDVKLTLTEFGILHCLASRPGFVRTRDQIISSVHGETTVLTSRTVDVHVTAIRRKLGDLGDLVQTVRGVGYRLDDTQ